MEPNYTEYSITELEDALSSIDKENFPERSEKIVSELRRRQLLQRNSSQKILEDDFEPNERFFRCPACEKKIGFFSKTANKWGRKKQCPHCNSDFESFMKLKVFIIALIPALLVHLFVFRPLLISLGLSGAISAGVLGGILSVLAIRYRKVRSTNVT